MTNDRLYYTEPARLTFEASVVAAMPDEHGNRIALDRTAFFPTSGGQPHDVGQLGGAAVLDVIDDDLNVWHVIDRSLDVGTKVAGVVDAARRRDHMQQHSGQHILSAAFDRLFDVRTESFHLGADASTIDLAREVTTAEVEVALAEANRIVWEDRPVTIRFVSADEAATLPLRKEPALGGRLRLIDVEDFDLSACGGTHVARTGEIGIIAVRRTERFKGGSRVEFVCGLRALRAFEQMREVLDRACRPLSLGAADLPGAIERLQSTAKEQRRVLKAMSSKLAMVEANELANRANVLGPWLVAVAQLEGLDASDLKTVASGFVALPGRVAALAGSGNPTPLVIARSADVALDVGTLFMSVAAARGGKGGGRPDLAQGSVPGDADTVLSTTRAALEQLLGRM